MLRVRLHVSAVPRPAHCSSVSHEQPNPGIHTRPGSHGERVGTLALHSHRPVVELHVSALISQSVVAFKHVQGGCRGSSVVFKQALPSEHGSKVGTLKLHSHLGGVIVLLQLSAVSPKQLDESRQEHPGCNGFSVVFIHIRVSSQTSKDGALKLHSQVGGIVVLLQVSALSKHWSPSRHEQAGWPTNSVIFRHDLPASHGIKSGALELHSQVGGIAVLLQVSAVSLRQSDASEHEHPGWSGYSVMLMQTRPISHAAKVGMLELHSHVGGIVVVLQESAFSKQLAASKQEHEGWSGFSVMLMHDLPVSHGAMEGKFPLHSQLGGVVVLLQESALSKQSVAIKHEHAGSSGCSVILIQYRPVSQTSKEGALLLHSQVGGVVVSLHVSAFSRH